MAADSTVTGSGPLLLQFDSIQSLKAHLDKMVYGSGSSVATTLPSPLCFHVVSHSFLVAANAVNAVQPTVQISSNDLINAAALPSRFKAKRKRGRPRKNFDPSVKRKPGRPRKHHLTEELPTVKCQNMEANVPKKEVEQTDDSSDVEEILFTSADQSSSSFSKELEAELRRPFDVSEFDRMLCEVSHRKPVMKLRQTRSGSMPFQTGSAGSSYLDHFPDFAAALARCSSSNRKFQLLLGFFFWLQHSCMPDSFKPWLATQTQDATECLEITPSHEILDMKVVLHLSSK